MFPRTPTGTPTRRPLTARTPPQSPTPHPDRIPTARLASVTRKQNEITTLLDQEPRNIELIKSEFSVYLERVENLYSESGEEHSEWLASHKESIDNFRLKLENIIHPRASRALSLASHNTRSSKSSKSSIFRQPLLEEKARLVARKETAARTAELRKREIRLKAIHEEDLLNIELQREQLETEQREKEITILEKQLSDAGSSVRGSRTSLHYESTPYEAKRTTNKDKDSTQCDIARTLDKVQLNASLPKRDLQLFDGSDITKYKPFIINFELIIGKCDDDGDKFLFLQQYTSGQAKRLVDTCVHYTASIGYEKARKLLEKEYGNDYKVANAYLAKLQSWPDIKSEDADALNDLGLFLLDCQNYLDGMSFSNQLQNPKEIMLVVNKLPYRLRDRWRRNTHKILEDHGMVYFRHLVEFVRNEASVLRQPLFGIINATETKSSRKKILSTVLTESSVSEDTEAKNSDACFYCKKDNHSLPTCRFFEALDYDNKTTFIKKNGICFACLQGKHFSKFCRRKLTCSECNKRHPTILHNEKFRRSDAQRENEVKNCFTKQISKTILTKTICPILPVVIEVDNDAKPITINCLLDSGSTDCWINEKLLSELKLKPSISSLNVSTLQGNNVVKTRVVNNLKVSDVFGKNAVRIPVVYTKENRNWPFNKDDILKEEYVADYNHFSNIPFEFVDKEILLIIGMNVPELMKPLEIVQGTKADDPFAARYNHGWTIHGNLKMRSSKSRNNSCRIKVSSSNIDEELDRFFSQDFKDLSVEKALSVNDRKWINKTAESKISLPDGHLQIALPLKENALFPNNRFQAYTIFQRNLHHLKKDKNLFTEYDNFIQDMLSKGHAEKARESKLEAQEKFWYIVHHGVRHKTKKKLRVVFNCSLKYKGVSLNDNLEQGPDLANSLVGVLLRFRQKSVAVCGDIRQMFYQVKIPENQRDYLRFFWVDESGAPAEYRLLVHVFGATSSPSVANYALKSTADNLEEKKEAGIIQEGFYVDDLLTSFDSEEEAIECVTSVSGILKKSGFTLAEFSSNSSRVERVLSEGNSSSSCSLVKNEVLALGVIWNKQEDSLQFELKQSKSDIFTKRELLRYLSSIYDPIGAISPALLPGKKLFQRACARKLDWDDELPTDLKDSWKKWKSDIDDLHKYSIPRCFKSKNIVTNVQLHLFCDGSQISYGCVAYLKLQYDTGEISTALISSKSRLTPMNNSTLKTIPRIELCAAKLAVELRETLKKELTYTIDSTVFWTDSTTVLNYIRSENVRFHRFVENKINFIRNFSDPACWKFVKSTDNPADIVSRGASPKQLAVSELWNKGPSFLHVNWEIKHENENESGMQSISSDDTEVKSLSLQTKTTADPTDQLMQSSPNWYKLKVRISCLLKFRERLLNKLSFRNYVPSVADLKLAEFEIIRHLQRKHFSQYITLLQQNSNLPKSCKLLDLNPFLDDDNILRVGGRISNFKAEFDIKHPIILPYCSVTKLLAQDIHCRIGHMGRDSILATLRRKYWVTKSNTLVRNVIRDCLVCRKTRGKFSEAIMANLPETRVAADTPPFTHVATDYFGPFFISNGRKQEKRYGVVFTCMASRSIHLELSHTLSTDSFIQALRRFICRRGNVESITSDNGKNFVGAQRELKVSIAEWNQKTLHSWCKQRDIEWNFNPPYSSHFGGVYERLIRSVRGVLNSILTEQNMKLNDENLHTLMCEIEAILNNRPLTEISSDLSADEALTPNHLLLLNAGVTFPPGLFSKSDNYFIRRWKQTQYLADLFWTRWKKEYLVLLQRRQKWMVVSRPHRVGDLVLVKDLALPRNQCPLGRITKVNSDTAGNVRSAEVRIAKSKHQAGNFETSSLTRPIVKLILLRKDTEL